MRRDKASSDHGFSMVSGILRLATSGMKRHERVCEHEICHEPALGDSLPLVECPVDAEVNSALAVLFLRLRERRETARQERADASVVAHRDPVKLVRHERERDVVGSIEFAQGLEDSAAKARVA